jgi:putative nucleotidyltransferase with HDIG domain
MDEIQFTAYPTTKVVPNVVLPGDLYIFTAGHFIKYKHEGDVLPSEKLEEFILKKLQFFFVDYKYLDSFHAWSKKHLEDEINETIELIGEENRDLAEQNHVIKDGLLTFITKEVTSESINEMIEKTRDFISNIRKRHHTDKFLGKMRMMGDTIIDHSTNVANLSTFLALNVGYSHQILLENIYLGALLHDYGKVKIDPKILDKGPSSKAFQTAIRKHPALGKTALLLDSGFHDDILRIISEHHERHDGKGYPKGLKGHRIFDLTKIVAIANYFDSRIRKMDSNESLTVKQKKAFKMLNADQGKMFDPKILAKCLKVMETIF